MQGIDWRSNTRPDQTAIILKVLIRFSFIEWAANVAFDGWNNNGDDALAGSNVVRSSGLTIDGAANKTLRVARTGYWETDLVDPKIDT